MNIQIITSEDGSHTLFNSAINEHYHSTKGAITESQFIFINNGYEMLPGRSRSINILEIGLGTGLNALLTSIRCEKDNRKVNYVAIEPYPIAVDILSELNYPGLVGSCEERNRFWMIHNVPWEVPHIISDNFILYKIKQRIQEIELQKDRFSLIYFDAFSPEVQPEMWTKDVFEKLFDSMEPGGLLLTYSVQGEMRRVLKTCGFDVVKVPGPPGKREITQASKPKIL